MKTSCIGLLCAVMFACAPLEDPMDVRLADHPSSLSPLGNDPLFTMEIEASLEDVELTDVQVTFAPIGGTQTVLNFELTTDLNDDGALGEGDVLTCIEPGIDLLGTDEAGNAFEIRLSRMLTSTRAEGLWRGEWLAD